MVVNLPPIGHKLVPRATPLHVSQLFMLILKETFSTLGDETYPYRTIDFDTTYNKESLKLGKKPLVVVSCGDIVYQSAALRDIASVDIHTFNSYKTAIVNSSVITKVISPNKTEVEIIGNEVLNCLITCRTILPKLTTIVHIDSINMTQVNKVYRDLPQYYVQCTLAYTMQYIWSHVIPVNVMESIIAQISVQEGVI